MSSTLEDSINAGVAGDVRVDFEAALAEDGRPLARVAPESGVGYSTLSAWRANTYRGDNATVEEKVRRWLVSRQARVRNQGRVPEAPDFVLTPTASRFWEILEFAQSLPDLVVIAGGAGIGKTTATREFQRRGSQVWIATMEPVTSEKSALLLKVGAALGLPRVQQSSLMSDAIQERMRGTRGLLIIDEGQHLGPPAMDQLRTLHDLTGVGVALVGNETISVNLGLDGRNPKYAQLRRRVGMRISRRGPLKGDIAMLLDAWGIESDAERQAAAAIAGRPGALGQMTKVLRIAGGLASVAGVAMAAEHIQAAWEQLTMEAV